MKRNLGFALVAVLMMAAVAQAQTESRQRFAVINGDVKFNMTRIERIGEIHSATIVLVRDESDGKSYRLESNRNYSAQTAEYRLTDLESKEYVAARYKLPLKSKTRSETADELRAAARSTAVVNMTLSTARASETLDEMSWRTESKARASKVKVKGTLSPGLVSVLGRLQTVLSVPPLGDFCYELVSHLQSGGCDPDPAVRLATLPPDCAFDAANGEPCSKEQNQRAQDIRKAGRGNRY